MHKSRLFAPLTILFVIVCATTLITVPVFAGSSIMERIQARGLQLIGKNAAITKKGSRPVKIKDNLKVTGDIRMVDGKLVDGVDVSALAVEVDALTSNVETVEADLGANAVRRANARTLVSDGGTGQFTSMALGDDGKPVIAYYNYATQDLMVTKCTATDCSGEGIVTNVDSENDVGNFPAIAIGADGNPVIVHFDYTNEDPRVTACTNPECTESVSTTVLSDGNVGYYHDIAIGADGLPVITVTDGNGYLVLVKCTVANCSEGNIVNEVVTTGTVTASSIILGASGDLHIVYLDSSNVHYLVCADAACDEIENDTTLIGSGDAQYQVSPRVAIAGDNTPVIVFQNIDADLAVLKCGAIDCTSGNSLTVIDSASDSAGGSPDLVIGENGYPIISVTDSPNSALRIVTCGDLSCSSNLNVITTVDSEGDVGHDTSIVIGVDGLPIVSEFTYESGRVKVIAAANPYFVNYFKR